MKSEIHETSIVHPEAKIGTGCKIGPRVIIDEHVVIGENCEVRANAVITGRTQIGSDNQIGYGVIIGAEPQDTSVEGPCGGVIIGDHNIIREYVTIHGASEEESSTSIGNNNFLMVGCHIAHNCQVGDHVFLVNNV